MFRTFFVRTLMSLTAAGALASAPAMADVIDSQRFRVSGFATLGLVSSGDEDLGFIQGLYQEGVFDGDWSVKSNSNVGLQLDAMISDQFSAAVQFVAKDRTENGLEESLSWAFLRYRWTPSITLRAGRLGPNNYMLSDYRNIGFAYLWVRPPTEFYSILSFESIDGLDVAYRTPLGSGTFTGMLQYGRTENTFERRGNQYDVGLDPVLSGTLAWENDLWHTQFSVSVVEFDTDQYVPGTDELGAALEQVTLFWPEAETLRQNMEAKGVRSHYYAFGLSYSPENWQFDSEISYIDTKVDPYGSLTSGYVSLGRHIGPTTVFAMLASAERQEDRYIVPDPPAAPPPYNTLLAGLQLGTQTLYDALQVSQQTVSLGVRWNILYNLAMKAQWDHTDVEAYRAGFWDMRQIPNEDKTIDTYTINLNYVF